MLDRPPHGEYDDNDLEVPLVVLSHWLESLLEGTPEVFDSIRYNTFEDGFVIPQGFEVSLNVSRQPDGTVSYHIQKEMPMDRDGYNEIWGFYWGNREEPKTLHTKTHHSRLHLSSIHKDDTREMSEGVDNNEIAQLLHAYYEAKFEGKISPESGIYSSSFARMLLSELGVQPEYSGSDLAFLQETGIDSIHTHVKEHGND